MINHYTVNMENPKSWDEYFYNMCKVVASNSKCLSRKIGALIVKDKTTVISTGSNGPPRGVQQCDKRWLNEKRIREYAIEKSVKHSGNDGISSFQYITKDSPFYKDNLEGKCPRYVPEMGFKSGQGLEWCVAGHAERNAIVNAARLGVTALLGTSIYMTCGVPCTPCMVEIINAGIQEIVCTSLDAHYDVSAQYLLDESNIKIRLYDFLQGE